MLWHNTIHRPSPKHLHRCTHCGPCIIQFKPQCTNENGRYMEDLPVAVGYRPGEGAFNGVTVTVMCLSLPWLRQGQGVFGWKPVVLVLLLLLPFQKATAFVSEVRKRLTASQLLTHGPISVFTPTVMPVFDLPPTCM